MPWINLPDGKTAAEIAAAAGLSVHGGSIPSGLLNRRNQFSDAFAKIEPAIRDYLKQKRNDEIANQLYNMEQPPRAEAVDPSLQGAPATRPFTGGEQGFKAHQLYQQYLKDQQADQPDTAMDDLQYQHAYRLAHPDEFPDSSSDPAMDDLKYQQEYRRVHPEEFPATQSQYVDTPQGRMTAHQWAAIQESQRKQQAKGIGGLTLDQLNQDSYVRYEDGQGNKISTEQADADPDHAFARPPGAKNATPYKQWTSAADLFRKAQSGATPLTTTPPEPKVMGQSTDPVNPPTLDKTPVQVKSVEEANALPPGTVFLTPDGRLKRKP